MRLEWWKKGMRDGMPICVGYLAVSFSFGIVAKAAGLGVLASGLLSAANVTSAGQFAALGLIASGAPYLEMAGAQLVINLRYSLMSASLSQKLAPATPVPHRLLMAFGVTDEIFGVSSAIQGPLSPFYTYGLMTVAIPGWVAGTMLGAALGGVLPARLLSALSVALYGMFIAIVVPGARQSRPVAMAVQAAVAAACLFAWLPGLRQVSAGLRIIFITLLVAGGAALLFPVKEAAHAE